MMMSVTKQVRMLSTVVVLVTSAMCVLHPYATAEQSTSQQLTPESAPTESHIVVLLPQSPVWRFSINRVRPAIDVALDTINASQLLPHTALRVVFGDSKCNIGEAINQAFRFYMARRAHLFLGPCCDYAAAPVARQTAYWNLPMITAGAMSGDFGRKKASEYKLLTRINADFNSLGRSLISFLEYYSWRRVKLIYQYNGYEDIVEKFCHLAADSFHRSLLASNMTQDYFKMLNDDDMMILKKMDTEIGRVFSGQCKVTHGKFARA